VNDALERLQDAGLEAGLVVDCSHGNSGKDPARQAEVAAVLASQIRAGQRGIRGVMIESHLQGGTQKLGPRATLRYGQSVTDACLSLEATLPLLAQLADAVRAGRPAGTPC
jgi:3-deoxy-7-phosphoheptulonate synthase